MQTLLTSFILDLENALFGAAILEGVHQRGLNGEQSPLCVGGRVGLGKLAIDNPLVGALDRGSIDGQVERCHDVGFRWRGTSEVAWVSL